MDDLLTGFVLGDYQLQERIGKGGMGVVYLARQITLDRLVAIKVLPPEFCLDQEYVDRFLREARAAAHLNHQNIIQVYDAGVSDNIYFIVMEHVNGKNLGQILREEGFLEEREALYAIQQTAEGLAFAHRMGIVHRDVKPDNIMLTTQGAVKIGDLGLAKWKPNEFEANLTLSGTTMGTPHYISPEQIRGIKDIDTRADIYSLGMTLYHLLNGKPAFYHGTGPEIMAQHLSDELPPLLNSHLSEATLELISMMTVKKREHRIQEMAEVAERAARMLGLERSTSTSQDWQSRLESRLEKSSHLSSKEPNSKKWSYFWDRIWQWGVRLISLAIVGLMIALLITLVLKKSQHEKKEIVTETKISSPENIESEPKAVLPPLVEDQTPPSSPEIETNTAEEKMEEMQSETAPEMASAPAETTTIEETPSAESDQSSSPEIAQEENPPLEPPTVQTIIHGPNLMYETTISSLQNNFRRNENNLELKDRITELDVGRSPKGDVEFKALLRVDFLQKPEAVQKFNSKIRSCNKAILELTPVELKKNQNLEIEVCRVLKPWAIKAPKPLNNWTGNSRLLQNPVSQYLNATRWETNWEYASRGNMDKWRREGANRKDDDYASEPLALDGDPQCIRFKLTQDSLNQPLRLNVLKELQGLYESPSQTRHKQSHYGWIIRTVNGSGEVSFASSYASHGGPQLVLYLNESEVSEPK